MPRMPNSPVFALIVSAVIGLGSIYMAVQSFLAHDVPDAFVELILAIVLLLVAAYAWRRVTRQRPSDGTS